MLRDIVTVLSDDVNDAHREAQGYDLDERARLKARNAVPSLLQELSDKRGMAWRDIAAIAGVSVSAVRKWRKDGAATADKRLALATMAAFLDLLDGFLIQDPVGWLELPMVAGYTVRHMDLYVNGRADLLLDIAGMRTKEKESLDLFDPDWREHYRTDFEVFEADDGHRSLRIR
jgi:hypothetical protein